MTRTTPHGWEIPDIGNSLAETRHKVKVYAAEHEITLAEAIKQLVEMALASQRAKL